MEILQLRETQPQRGIRRGAVGAAFAGDRYAGRFVIVVGGRAIFARAALFTTLTALFALVPLIAGRTGPEVRTQGKPLG